MPHVFRGKGAIVPAGAELKKATWSRASITVEGELDLNLAGYPGWHFTAKEAPKITLKVERDRLIFSHPKFPGDFVYQERGAHGHPLFLEPFIDPLTEKQLPPPSPSEKWVGILTSAAVFALCIVLGFLLIRFVLWLIHFIIH